MLTILPTIDSEELAAARQRELDIPRLLATELGHSAVAAIRDGWYVTEAGSKVDWSGAVAAARAAKVSIPPDAVLPAAGSVRHADTRVQVSNETTLQAARRLTDAGARPLALNFANGVQPGGGFLHGARAQEEGLCRSSALIHTLVGDEMYVHHREHAGHASTDWAILSPDVPVFRTDAGRTLDEPWLLSILTCAAPYAPAVGQTKARQFGVDPVRWSLTLCVRGGAPDAPSSRRLSRGLS